MNINISDFLINLIIISINKKYNTNYTRSDIKAIHFYATFISITLNDKRYRIDTYLSLNNINIRQI